jgi:hypothetical protein
MSDIVITKINGDASDPVSNCTTLTIRNFQSLDFNLSTPISDFPIPELPDTCNILVKAEGNSLTISIAWTIKDEPLCVPTPLELWDGTFPLSGTHANGDPKVTLTHTLTVQEQLAFILDYFQPQSIEDAYSITVDGITRGGFPRNWTFSKSATSPIIYDARVEFIAGNLVSGD